ncbi:hypothetical protein Scep_009784 [Stephania cephalantha]|uniref:Uncharacterized protein n=1 Tax=Stephania cephalantha TaxID=152367 RepID=A0AAP0JV86_9MAGN
MSSSLSVLFHEYCMDFSWDFTHWTRHCISWVTECRSFDEKGQEQRCIGRLPLRLWSQLGLRGP